MTRGYSNMAILAEPATATFPPAAVAPRPAATARPSVVQSQPSAVAALPPAVAPQRVRLKVPATVEWVDTGVDLAVGRSIEIRASGQWSNAGPPAQGPGGFTGYLHPGTIAASAPLAALVARIGESTFVVGERFSGASPATGRLYLCINDTAGNFDDNQGFLSVTIHLP